MTRTNRTLPDTFTSALKAIGDLLEDGFAKIEGSAGTRALIAHAEIEQRHVGQKTGPFYRHFIPLRKNMVGLLAESYRRYFKMALAHPTQTGSEPDSWARSQLQPAVRAALEWIRDWYVLACDGENQRVRHVGSVEFVPGHTVSLSIPTTVPPFPPPTSWRAPAWLFQVSPSLGIGQLKSEHVPANDSEEKLSVAHTRLVLKGARRSFVWELEATIETVRNEEIAAVGAIPGQSVDKQTEDANKRKASKESLRGKGTEGLSRKTDLSRYRHYMDSLTEKQQLAFSLKHEYGLKPTEIALRMDLDRKTAQEHIEAANRKIDQVLSKEKAKARRAKSEPE